MTRLGSLCSPLAPLPPFSYAQDVPCGYRCCPASRCCPVSQLYGVSCRCVVLASHWSHGHTPVRAWSLLGAMMVVVVVVVTVRIVYLTVNKHKYCRKTKERDAERTSLLTLSVATYLIRSHFAASHQHQLSLSLP